MRGTLSSRKFGIPAIRMTRRDFLAFGAALPLASRAVPQLQNVSFEGEEKFNEFLMLALDGKWASLPIGEIVGRVGLALRETPYVGWTLERNADREFCFVTLAGLDCVTLFESSLGFARMLKRWHREVAKNAAPNIRLRRPVPADLVAEVATTRYRGGKVGDYTSRLHYTSDWMDDNIEKGVVDEVLGAIKGSLPLGKRIDYMSRHVETYRQLRAHPELVDRIRSIERIISARENLYLPTDKIEAAERKFKTGDIVGLTTTMEGMDVAHTGLLICEKGHARFLHASSQAKKVILDERISAVAASSPRYSGIMAVRPIDVAS